MLNCIGDLDSNTDVLQVLEDSLANKATGTLLKLHHPCGDGQSGLQLQVQVPVSISLKIWLSVYEPFA